MPVTAKHLRIHGRVQGVFFRASTKEKADFLGVEGWVKNCADGSVEVYLEGEQDTVGQLIDWCRRGPEKAHVDEVEIEDAAPQHCKEFSIIPDDS